MWNFEDNNFNEDNAAILQSREYDTAVYNLTSVIQLKNCDMQYSVLVV